MTAPLLEVDELTVGYTTAGGPIRPVDRVSLRVEPGEIVGVVGESGCGKTTLMRSILGLLPKGGQVVDGEVRFDGRRVVGVDTPYPDGVRGPGIGLVPQEPLVALDPLMRVGDQIAEGPRKHLRYDRATAARHTLELLDLVGMPDPSRAVRAYPHELSGGMCQRVAIALALASRPRLVLCDEPTTALDVLVQGQILRLLAALCADLGVALVYVTHDLAVVAELCSRVSVMYAGRFVETGSVHDVFTRPAHPYALGLLRSVPDLAVGGTDLFAIPGIPPQLTDLPSGCRFRPRCTIAHEDCAVGKVELRSVGSAHEAACLHHDELASMPAMPDGAPRG